MFDDPSGEDLRSLLQAVEMDTMRTSSNRDRIKSSVLAAFDEATGVPTENESEVITLVQVDDETPRSPWSRRAIPWAAAAAVAMIVAAIVLLPDDGTRIDTAAPTAIDGLSLDGTDLPAPLLPGPQRTDLIASGLSFEAPEGLVVADAGEGQLILALADDPAGTSGQLIIVDVALSDWQGRLSVLAEAGEVSLKGIGVMVDGTAATRLDVTITNEALAARSCVVGEPCMSLDGGPVMGPAALWAGSDNRIVEIGRTNDSLVLAIEVTQRFQGTLSGLAAQVVSSASLSSD